MAGGLTLGVLWLPTLLGRGTRPPHGELARGPKETEPSANGHGEANGVTVNGHGKATNGQAHAPHRKDTLTSHSEREG